MRKELYKAIKERINGLYKTEAGDYSYLEKEKRGDNFVPVIKHVGYWNRNVEFVEEDVAWDRPAVFIEFKPIQWQRSKEKEARGNVTIHLHIVNDWVEAAASDINEPDSELEIFDIVDAVVDVVDGTDSRYTGRISLVESHTNHDHEELIESIEVFTGKAMRIFKQRS